MREFKKYFVLGALFALPLTAYAGGNPCAGTYPGCCPLDRFENYVPPQPPTNYQECGSSYWYDAQQALTGWTLADFASPAENVMMTDSTISHLDDSTVTKGVNLLFADFHVKIYTWNERTALLNAQGLE